MHARRLLLPILVLLAAVGCDQRPPTGPEHDSLEASGETGLYASSAGMTAASVSGSIGIAGGGPPGDVLVTPSGVCHLFDMPVVNQFTGDVEGLATFHEQLHDMWCDGTMLIISGPFEGEFTWNGLTGPVEGRFKIDCRSDGTPPPTCVTKVMKARGSGDLEGVLFQFDVQPGWFPFDYSGRVLSR